MCTYHHNNDLKGNVPMTAEHYSFEWTQDHIHVSFPSPRMILSSGVLNGGMTKADHFVNMRVGKDTCCADADFSSPEKILKEYCRSNGWEGISVGMMTAASMYSFRHTATGQEGGVKVSALVTSGLSNIRRAGDPAEWRQFDKHEYEAHTINIALLTNATLTPSCMAEALAMVTEAKVTVLQDLEALSPLSEKPATGTGTDSVAIISGIGSQTIRYCGKHVLFGEMLSKVVYDALYDSLSWYRVPKDFRQTV